eukprot:g11586.t1
MSARKVFRNYVRTWMALDVTLVSLDWIFVILEVSGIQITSVAQLSRTIRLVRILRWVKLRRMAEMFQELIQSQSAGMYWSLVFGIARLLILNHLVASRSRTTTETFFSVLIAFRSLITCTTLISRMTSLMTALIKTKEDEKSLYQLEFLDHLMHEKDLQIVHAMQDISMKALISVPVAAKDIIFLGGNLAGKSYLILTGEFAYYHEKGKVTLDNDAGWIAEMPGNEQDDLKMSRASRVWIQRSSGKSSGNESAKEYARHFISGMRRKRYWTDLVADDLTEEAENSSFGTVTHLPTLNKDRAQKGSKCCPLFSRKRKTPYEVVGISHPRPGRTPVLASAMAFHGTPVEVRKHQKSTTWYSGELIDINGEDSIKVPPSSVRRVPEGATDDFDPQIDEVVEVLLPATESTPSGWGLGTVKTIKNSFYFITFDPTQKGKQDASIGRSSQEEQLDVSTMLRKLLPVEADLHSWIKSQDSSGCLSHVQHKCNLLVANCTNVESGSQKDPEVLLIGGHKEVRLATMLLELIHFKHQIEMQRFHEHRDHLMERLAEAKQWHSAQNQEARSMRLLDKRRLEL